MKIKMSFRARVRNLLLLALLAVTCYLFPVPSLHAQQSAGTNYGSFSAAFAHPALSGAGTATLTYTAGTIYKGGSSQAITAGTLTSLDASQSSCAAPLYSSCDIVYWASGTGLSFSNVPATAFASGNVIIGFLTTDGSSKILTITPATLLHGANLLGPAGQHINGEQDSSGASLALTAAMCGQAILLDRAAGTTVTLPAPPSTPGCTFDFFVQTTVTSNADKIITNAGTVFLLGTPNVIVNNSATSKGFTCDGASHVSLNMNGTTTGGIAGAWVRVVNTSSTIWQVFGNLLGSGTIATPCATS